MESNDIVDAGVSGPLMEKAEKKPRKGRPPKVKRQTKAIRLSSGLDQKCEFVSNTTIFCNGMEYIPGSPISRGELGKDVDYFLREGIIIKMEAED